MNKPLEPGCRAVILGSTKHPCNNGVIVTVEERLFPGQLIEGFGKMVMPGWMVTTEGSKLRLGQDGTYRFVATRPYGTKFLHRLDDFEPDESLWATELKGISA